MDVSGVLHTNADTSINGITVGRGGGNIYNNIVVGSNSLQKNTTGNSNVAVGYQALYSNTDGSNNTAVGSYSGYALTAGTSNTSVGWEALSQNSTGSYNTSIGYISGNGCITGINNTFLGRQAQTVNPSVSNSTAIGCAATITTSNQIVLGTASEKIYVPGSYLGIGVYSPSNGYALDVIGNVNVTNGGLTVTGATNINTTGTSTTTIGNTNGITIFNSNVGIGPSANPPQFTLDVSGGTIGAWSLTTYSSITSTNGNMSAYNITANSTLSGVNINASNSITSPSFNTPSDYRIKKDVIPLDEKFTVDKLLSLIHI